jgi:uncharacterized protein (TIGR02147 family)
MVRCWNMIFTYDDFRSYLKARIKALPKNGHGEAKRMAAHLKVSSTFMSHVLSGSKQLSQEQTSSLSIYLGHSDLETEYFFYLVQIERAGNQSLKKFFQKKMDEIKEKSHNLADRVKFKKDLTDEQKSIFYSSPLYSAVHLFTSIKEKGVTLEEIQSRFNIDRAKVSEVLKFLKETSLCEQVGNAYKMGTQSTHLSAHSPHIVKHHTNWRLRAIEASEDLSTNELMYTVNVSLSKKDFEKLREEMVTNIQKFLETVYESPAEDIATFNMDWFWIRK